MQSSFNLQRKKPMSNDYQYLDPDFSYINPKTGVLRNLADITDQDILLFVESGAVAKRLQELYENPIKVKDISALFKIHKILFQNIYAWAGEKRIVEISKGGKQFFPTIQFDNAYSYIENLIKEYKKIKGNDKQNLAYKLAEILDSVNYLHPFREGNGRAQREFIRLLAIEKGLILNLNPPDNISVYEKYMEGTINSDIETLYKLIFEQINEGKK